jgi:hypothetical protein
MGFSPRDVDEMTPWEFHCCLAGYHRAHSSDEDKTPPMSDERLAELGIAGFD